MKTYPPLQSAIVLALGLCATMATSPPHDYPLIITASTTTTLSDGDPVHFTMQASAEVLPRANYFVLELYLDSGNLAGVGRSVRIIPDNPSREIVEHEFDVDNRFLSFAMLQDCDLQEDCITGLTIEYVDAPNIITQSKLTATAELALPEGSATPPRGSISIRVE